MKKLFKPSQVDPIISNISGTYGTSGSFGINGFSGTSGTIGIRGKTGTSGSFGKDEISDISENFTSVFNKCTSISTIPLMQKPLLRKIENIELKKNICLSFDEWMTLNIK